MNENDFNVFVSEPSFFCSNSTFGMDGSFLVAVTFYEGTFSKLYVTGYFSPRIPWFRSYSSRTSVCLSFSSIFPSYFLQGSSLVRKSSSLSQQKQKRSLHETSCSSLCTILHVSTPFFSRHRFETYTQSCILMDINVSFFWKGVKSEARKTNGRRRKRSLKTLKQKQYCTSVC